MKNLSLYINLKIIKLLFCPFVFLLFSCNHQNNPPASIDWPVIAPEGMKLIKGGTFKMGQSLIAEPVHQVTLASFFIDTTEVTQEDYTDLMGYNPAILAISARFPVEFVTWYDAVLYCNRRSQRDNKDTVYSYSYALNRTEVGCPGIKGLTCSFEKIGYRLPTEAEWEYVCRAGTTTTFYWGTDTSGMGAHAWSGYNAINCHEVAMRIQNAWGIFDMAGNVAEWCNDGYGDYSPLDQTSPTGAINDTLRIRRGGGWVNGSLQLSSSYREMAKPGESYNGTGFRVVLPCR